MNGKYLAKTACMFLAGLAAGYALSQFLSYKCCGDDGCSCEDKPPLRVKPVPITIKKKQGENV